MDETFTFGQYLKRRRKELDLTQSKLAEEARCSVDTVKKIEAGLLRPSRQLAELLAVALQIEKAEAQTFVRFSRAPLPRRSPEAVTIPSPMPVAQPAVSGLPFPPTSLIGREQEAEAVRALILRGDVRLLTLTGAPGIGKTRLALHVAAGMVTSFRHGIFFVSLAPVVDPALVMPQIAQILHVREGGDQPLLETLKSYLRDKEMLLVLDNFEQVATAAPLLVEVLAAAPHVKAMVTSRARLHVGGEHELPVPALTMPDPDALPPLAQLTRYEAVRLFVERAAALRPGFELTVENAPAVARICFSLDGLPLAIELAAARIKILPPAAMLSRLQHRLRLLASGDQDLPARQRTLRKAIEWSYDLLEAEEKKLFRRLAVFHAGATFDAIEAACKGGEEVVSDPKLPVGDAPSQAPALQPLDPVSIDVLDSVDSLVDKSLLRQEEGVGGESRFNMLQTIHEYARERLDDSGEAEQVQWRHTLFFLALAEQADPYLRGAQQLEWIARLEQEHDNFRSALAWCLDASGVSEGTEERRIVLGLRLVSALAWFWARHSHMAEGRKWIEEALERAGGNDKLRHSVPAAAALYGAGVIAYLQGDQQTASDVLEESLCIYRTLGDKQHIAGALVYLGVARGYLRRNVDEGRPLLEEGVRLYRELGDKWGLATAISFLGFLPLVEGDYAGALALFEEALPLYEATGDKASVGWVMIIMGEATRCLGDYQTARALYEQSLVLHRELGDKHRIAVITNNLGYVAMYQGDYDHSAAYFKESMALLDETGSRSRVLSGVAGLAGLASATGQPERAARLFGAAEALAEARHFNFEPSERLEFERNVGALRASMEPERFATTWKEGRSMNWDEAIMYATGVETWSSAQ